MKKALVDVLGYIKELHEPGKEFEIYEGPDASMAWVDVPDDCTVYWTLEWSPASKSMVLVKRDGPYTNPLVKRIVSYGEVGEQLDMIFKDIQDNNLENGRWINHIKTVKSTTPKPPNPHEARSLEEELNLRENDEPSPEKEPKLSTVDLPSWVRYPGWKGYESAE
jgi:hypothetical protein